MTHQPLKMKVAGLIETQFHPTPGSKRSTQLHKMYQSRCTPKNSWWWAESLPETCRVVIPIKVEFGASVGFIHNVGYHFSSYLDLQELSLNLFMAELTSIDVTAAT